MALEHPWLYLPQKALAPSFPIRLSGEDKVFDGRCLTYVLHLRGAAPGWARGPGTSGRQAPATRQPAARLTPPLLRGTAREEARAENPARPPHPLEIGVPPSGSLTTAERPPPPPLRRARNRRRGKDAVRPTPRRSRSAAARSCRPPRRSPAPTRLRALLRFPRQGKPALGGPSAPPPGCWSRAGPEPGPAAARPPPSGSGVSPPSGPRPRRLSPPPEPAPPDPPAAAAARRHSRALSTKARPAATARSILAGAVRRDSVGIPASCRRGGRRRLISAGGEAGTAGASPAGQPGEEGGGSGGGRVAGPDGVTGNERERGWRKRLGVAGLSKRRRGSSGKLASPWGKGRWGQGRHVPRGAAAPAPCPRAQAHLGVQGHLGTPAARASPPPSPCPRTPAPALRFPAVGRSIGETGQRLTTGLQPLQTRGRLSRARGASTTRAGKCLLWRAAGPAEAVLG